MRRYYRRLPLGNTYNTRELGGFPAGGGKITKYGKFIRSSLIHTITESDIEYIKAYGVLSCLDFRSAAERSYRKNALEPLPFITYKAVPLIEQLVETPMPEYVPPADMTWDAIYIDMLHKNPGWTQASIEFAAACPGTLIYNCRAGKDRTGIFTAYLLSIAGVPEDDIIADYCVSQVYLEPVFKMERAKRPDLPPDSIFFTTPPSAMRSLLSYFNENYGGAEGFLNHCGVSDKYILKIREKLLG